MVTGEIKKMNIQSHDNTAQANSLPIEDRN